MATSTVFRNVDFDPADSADAWPFEAIVTVIERGSIGDWRRLAAAILDDPWGRVAQQTAAITAWGDHYGIDALLTEVVAAARRRFRERHRRADGERLRGMRAAAGMTLVELAGVTGLTPALLSRYENGQVSPTLDSVARIEYAINRCRRRAPVKESDVATR